jgi:hypothetical protein
MALHQLQHREHGDIGLASTSRSADLKREEVEEEEENDADNDNDRDDDRDDDDDDVRKTLHHIALYYY